MLKSIKIGPITYQVQEVKDLHTHEGDTRKYLHGEIKWADATIRVEIDQADDRKVVTLWHEAIHGILENAGQDDHPENLVIALGFGVVQLMRDNPELVRLTMEQPEALPDWIKSAKIIP